MKWKLKKVLKKCFNSIWRNIFLKDTTNYDYIKLGDFGLAVAALNTYKTAGHSTIDYSAPELMEETTLKSFNFKTDIW